MNIGEGGWRRAAVVVMQHACPPIRTQTLAAAERSYERQIGHPERVKCNGAEASTGEGAAVGGHHDAVPQ